MRIAVIGTGISGLASAWLLDRAHEVHVFEREPRLGGHTHTIDVDPASGAATSRRGDAARPDDHLAVDTGFIVYNEPTYPNLTRKLFVHHFAHAQVAYPFATGGRADWMARNFFTDGLMPSADLLLHVAGDLHVDDRWAVAGTHYARTCEAWIDRMDAERPRILQLFADTYGAHEAEAWFHRWRTFNLACAELFAYGGGDEWIVAHLRLRKV